VEADMKEMGTFKPLIDEKSKSIYKDTAKLPSDFENRNEFYKD
jgi:hypothetical protein